MHVLQRLENWRSSYENTARDDIIHCLCVPESFQRSLELADMLCSGEREKQRFATYRNSRYKFLDRIAILTVYVVAILL